MNVYITGANGFIGSSLMDFYKNEGYKVIGISHGDNELKSGILYTDYKDIEWLKSKICAENHILIHTAAFIPVGESSRETLEINNGINNFIAETFLCSYPNKVVFFSSIAVYGYGYKDLEDITEDSPLFIKDYYAQSKKNGELILSDAFDQTYILRLSSPYGKKKRKKSVLENMVEKALNNKDIPILGEGNRTQDFIYIDDICKVVNAIIAGNMDKGIYNLASGYPCKMIDLADNIINIFNSNSRVFRVEGKETNSVKISNQKLKDATKIEFMDTEQGIKKLREDLRSDEE